MVNVAKREDGLLDWISRYRNRQQATLWHLKEMETRKAIHPEAAEILRRVLTEDNPYGNTAEDQKDVSSGTDDGNPGVQQTGI